MIVILYKIKFDIFGGIKYYKCICWGTTIKLIKLVPNFNSMAIGDNLLGYERELDIYYQFLKIDIIKKYDVTITSYFQRSLRFYFISQLLSGLAISLALLYAMSRVKHVCPRYTLSVFVTTKAKSGILSSAKQRGNNNCILPS